MKKDKVPLVVQQKRIRLGTMRLRVRFLALLSGFRIGVAVSCGVGRRRGLVLVWLWCRLVATALIGPLSLGTSMCHGYGPQKDKK